MTQAMDLNPPSEPGEIETLTFDFGAALGAGESVSSVLSILCAVVVGSDVATGHFQGSSTLAASPSTGATNGAVLQQVRTMVGGCTYQFQCLVLTSAAQRLQLRVNLPCAAVPAGSV